MKNHVFVKTVLMVALLPWLLVGAINLVVDPLNIYRLVNKEGFNQVKPRVQRFERLAKPLQMERVNAPLVVLGTSRVEYGINPRSPWLERSGQPAYNAGVSSATLKDLVPIARHAVWTTDVEEFLVDMDMYMFHAFNGGPWRFGNLVRDHRWDLGYLPAQWLSTLPSYDILNASRATVRRQDDQDRLNDLGWMDNDLKVESNLEKGGLYRAFEALEQNYANVMWTPCEDGSYYYTNGYSGYDTFARLGEMLDLARTHDIKLTFFTQPAHARMMVALEKVGLWEQFEQWKRDFVTYVFDYKARYPELQVQVWDFNLFNAVTEETVPEPDDQQTRMQYYIDSAHYRHEVGEKILAAMFGEHADPALGVKLQPNMLEAHLQDQRKKRDQWKDSVPDVVGDLERIAIEGIEYRKRNGIRCFPAQHQENGQRGA